MIVFRSGLVGGYLPTRSEALPDMDMRSAVDYLRSEVDEEADQNHAAGVGGADACGSSVDCDSDELCIACSALAEIDSVLVDDDYLNGVCVLVDEWHYMEVSVVQ